MMRIVHSNAAGIDIGAKEFFVAIPEDGSESSVRKFECFTDDLHKAAKWMKDHRIDSVAMESTGVYWIPIYQILDSYGFEIFLVNAGHVKNVPGRKTDVKDSQWLQYLHSVGLLESSYRPDQEVCVIRSLLRHRSNMLKMASSGVVAFIKYDRDSFAIRFSIFKGVEKTIHDLFKFYRVVSVSFKQVEV